MCVAMKNSKVWCRKKWTHSLQKSSAARNASMPRKGHSSVLKPRAITPAELRLRRRCPSSSWFFFFRQPVVALLSLSFFSFFFSRTHTRRRNDRRAQRKRTKASPTCVVVALHTRTPSAYVAQRGGTKTRPNATPLRCLFLCAGWRGERRKRLTSAKREEREREKNTSIIPGMI